jgi:hypothetical protein
MIKIDVKTTHHKKVTEIYQYISLFSQFSTKSLKIEVFSYVYLP